MATAATKTPRKLESDRIVDRIIEIAETIDLDFQEIQLENRIGATPAIEIHFDTNTPIIRMLKGTIELVDRLGLAILDGPHLIDADDVSIVRLVVA